MQGLALIHAQRQNLGRLQRGLRTREEEYYRPVLLAISELGGSGKMKDILDRVEQIMKNTLKEVD